MTLEQQQLCQRIQDEQGYIVFCDWEGPRQVGEVIADAFMGNGTPMPSLVICGHATREEYISQRRKYVPLSIPESAGHKALYFWKAKAE